MSIALYVLGVWLIASIPVGLLVGWACRLNGLAQDDELARIDNPTRTQAAVDPDRGTRDFAAAA